jgi:hypothetical protein
MPVSIGLLGRQAAAAGGSGTVYGAALIRPAAIADVFLASARAQAGGVRAFSFGTDGETWLQYAADTPRFFGAERWLLLEGQRTNAIRYAGFEGGTSGVIGSGGGFSAAIVVAAVTGLTVTLTTGLDEDGLPAIDVEYAGTHAGGIANLIFWETTSAVAANSGEVWRVGQFVKLQSGALTNMALTHLMQFVGATTTGAGSIVPTGSPLGQQRFEQAFTAGAGTTAARPGLRCTFTAGAVAAKLRIAVPSLALVDFLSSPILPPIGSPGAATRGVDSLTGSFSALFPTGIGTLLGTVVIPQNAPTGIDQTIIEMHDGSANNRVRLRNAAGGATIVAGRTVAGSATDATSLGSMTAGTAFKFGITWDGVNVVANLNGGTNQTVAGVPGGLTTLRIGADVNGDNALFGRVGYLDALPYVIPAANLPAAVSAMPS